MTTEKKFQIQITQSETGWLWRVYRAGLSVADRTGSASSEILARYAAEKNTEELREKPELKPTYTYEVE